jgi:hypothetical protein
MLFNLQVETFASRIDCESGRDPRDFLGNSSSSG